MTKNNTGKVYYWQYWNVNTDLIVVLCVNLEHLLWKDIWWLATETPLVVNDNKGRQ